MYATCDSIDLFAYVLYYVACLPVLYTPDAFDDPLYTPDALDDVLYTPDVGKLVDASLS